MRLKRNVINFSDPESSVNIARCVVGGEGKKRGGKRKSELFRGIAERVARGAASLISPAAVN